MKTRPMRAAFVASVAAAAVAVAGCTASSEGEGADEETTLTIAVSQLTGQDWDALQGGWAWDLQQQASFDSLFYWNAYTNESTPRLATGYEIADDRLSLEVELRDDVEFVDGVHFDAQALKTYFDALMTSEWGGLGATGHYGATFEVVDEYTLKIMTTKPMYSDFLRIMLGYAQIQSPASVDDPEGANASPMGSGPYVIDESIPDVEMSYVRNPDYWDPEAYPFDRVVLKLYVDKVAALNALKTGQVDVARIDPQMATEAESSGLVVHESAGNSHMLLVFNWEEPALPALRDKRVRQAMMLAFDREAILENLYLGYGQVSSQAFTEGQPEWIEGGDERYGYDPERARELMTEAGYADGFDVTIPADYPEVQPIIEQYLGDIGIRVTFKGYGEQPAAMDGTAPLTVWYLPFPDQVRILTEVYSEGRRFLVPDRRTLDLVQQIRGVGGDAEASQELGEYILDEAWIIPFTKPSDLWATIPEVDVDITLDEFPDYSGLYVPLWTFQPVE